MFILYIKILHFSNVKDVSEVLEISTFDDDDNIQDDFPCDLLGKVLEKLRTKYKFGRIERSSFVFTGLNIHQDENMEITVDQSDFIDQKLEINEYEKDEP